jgi:hypothetical protein
MPGEPDPESRRKGKSLLISLLPKGETGYWLSPVWTEIYFQGNVIILKLKIK